MTASLMATTSRNVLLAFVLSILAEGRSCATTYSIVRADEGRFLSRLFSTSQTSLDVRCEYITDARVLQALRNAARRGVAVRVMLDRIDSRSVRTPGSPFKGMAVQIMSRTNRGRFFADRGQHGYAIVDRRTYWFGGRRWDRREWSDRNLLMDSNDPLIRPPVLGVFEWAWQHYGGIQKFSAHHNICRRLRASVLGPKREGL